MGSITHERFHAFLVYNIVMDLRNLLLPGGIGLSRIKVYDQPGPDGIIGGGAHFHAVSSESYYVVAGTGKLELLSYQGFEVLDLEPNKVVYFRPGVIHRVCNPNKDLVILSIMQNGGVAERTDFFLTFPMDTISDARTYQKAALSRNLTEALARRDLSIRGFQILRDAMENEPARGRELLQLLYHRAQELMKAKFSGLEWFINNCVFPEAKGSYDAIEFLRDGNTTYLENSAWNQAIPETIEEFDGITGRVMPYVRADTLQTAPDSNINR
jgi:mannose-6-phosphate isomerase-like protein (cupin superfamily)